MDVDALEPGVDFVERIEAAVGSADALIVVIGRDWLTARDADGARRLDDPDDFVRIEVASALRRRIRVIPILVGGAVMPRTEELPPVLADLARRNALVMSDLDWKSGTERLVTTLERVLGHEEAEAKAPEDVPVEPAPPPTFYGRTKRDEAEQDRYAGPAALLTGALELVGAGLLVLGTALRVDEFAHPDFGPANAPNLGFFTSLAPMGLVVGALGALALSHTRTARRLGVGLLLGFAAGGVAKYIGLLGIASVRSGTDNPEPSGAVTGSVLALIGAGLLTVVALRRALVEPAEEGEQAAGAARALVAVGAVLVVVGALVPFNDGPGLKKPQVLIERFHGWEALDPLACMVVALVAAFLLTRRRGGMAASGAIIALGLLSTLLWLRYVAVPALQPDSISSPAAGGFIGLAGAASILVGGLVARAQALRAGFAGRVSAGPVS